MWGRWPPLAQFADSYTPLEGNPAWFLPVTIALLVVGLVWIMVYYISQTVYPLGSGSPINLGPGNIVVGFGLMMVGFGFLTRWK